MNQDSEDTKRLTRQQDRCSVSLIIRDSAGYTIHEHLSTQMANIDDAMFLVRGLSSHVDDELTYMEECREADDAQDF